MVLVVWRWKPCQAQHVIEVEPEPQVTSSLLLIKDEARIAG